MFNFVSYLKSIYFFYAICISIVILFSVLSGDDYLYYYLPGGAYLFEFRSFPNHLLPSHTDGPLAYPPAEFFIMAVSYLFGKFSPVFIKSVILIKIFLFTYLFFELSKKVLNKFIFNIFLLNPTLIQYLFIYNSDINILLAIASTILYYFDSKFRILTIILLTYAVLSKYTFWPFYIGILIYFYTKKKMVGYLFIPILFLIPFLVKNFSLYDNPIFPYLYSVFAPQDPVGAELEGFMKSPFNILIIILNLTGSLLPLGMFLKITKDKLLGALIIIYSLIWIFMMQAGSQPMAIRFILPLTLIIFFLLSINSLKNIINYGIIAQITLFMILYNNIQMTVYSVGLIFQTLIILFFKYKTNIIKYSFPIIILIFSFARFSKKISFDFDDLGYSAHQKEINVIQSISINDKILTDFYLTPYELRRRENVYFYESVLFDRNMLSLMKNEKTLNDLGINYLFLSSASLQKKYFSEYKNVNVINKIGDYSLIKINN